MLMKKFVSALACLLALQVVAQKPVEVVENTLKVAAWGDEEFYYGFAAGDQLIFNFEETKGKELKEVEILEWPATSKFMDYKTSRIQNKVITIPREGVYKFRFKNGSISGRVCKFRIQRIPASDASRSYNTTVYWRTLYDTTIVPTQERYLVKSDTMVHTILEQNAKVYGQQTTNGQTNRTLLEFNLPQGTAAWSYYIGTGGEGMEEYYKAREKYKENTNVVSSIPGYSVMAALALQGLNYFNRISGEDNVKYSFLRDANSATAFREGRDAAAYAYKTADVINDAAQMKTPAYGKVYLGLLNDNLTETVRVMVKVHAVVLNQQWNYRTVDRMNIRSRTEPYTKN
jgi:hypothetical protein